MNDKPILNVDELESSRRWHKKYPMKCIIKIFLEYKIMYNELTYIY